MDTEKIKKYELLEERIQTCFTLILMVGSIILFVCALKMTHDRRSNVNGYYTSMRETELEYWECKFNIVREIEVYIHSVTDEHNLSALELLNGCDKYNIDVRLAMAQGQVESAFGTKGLASKTNSVWNYKAYDGCKLDNVPSYKHPNLSIDPYLKLIRQKYLGNTRTEQDLLDNFTDVNGKRYASNELYEKELKLAWGKINNDTKLDSLLNHYRNLKIKLSY